MATNTRTVPGKRRILVEGIGGIGGVVAAKMLEAGADATLVTGNSAISEAIRRGGLHATTPDRVVAARAAVFTTLNEIPDTAQFDAAYLLMKANTVVEAARKTLPYLKPEGYLVTFQNGIVEEAVSAVAGPERVISGIIGWGGTMHAPGVYEKTSVGNTIIGELDGRVTDRVQDLAWTISPAAPVVISPNIRGALWSKLAINCTITTLGALTGETLGTMLEDQRVRHAFLFTYSEVIDTALALGIRLERIAVHPKLLYLSRNAGATMRFYKDVLMRIVGRKYGKLKSSMLQSLERGRPTEVDYLNGYVVEQAKKLEEPVPLNAALTRMIQEIESGTRSLGPQNMDELLAVIE
ncbi:MAG: 2-dehydropantoate 2-reductase [Candidatus Hydrogenedentes bacterium]|nr:2-dehydropantoate 2-reductase [Candidatus Hydrogenedentota bacterium]